MSRQTIPLATKDLSTFARHLAGQLHKNATPGHVELLNMLARAAGFRNFQHLRAASMTQTRLDTPAPLADQTLVERALRRFDSGGRMRDWPARRGLQILCLWALLSQLPAATDLHERQLGAALNAAHAFGDAALLRRDMVGLGLLTRTPDGTVYRRCELPPPPEGRDLIRHVTARRKASS